MPNPIDKSGTPHSVLVPEIPPADGEPAEDDVSEGIVDLFVEGEGKERGPSSASGQPLAVQPLAVRLAEKSTITPGSPPSWMKPTEIRQIMQGIKRLSSMPAVLDDFAIQDRMDAIYEILSLLPPTYHPLGKPEAISEITQTPFLENLFILIFSNFSEIIRQAPDWYGIREMGRRLTPPFKNQFRQVKPALALAVEQVHSQTVHAPPYFPLTNSERETSTITVRELKDPRSRRQTAEALFRYSRGNPELASLILKDLDRLVEEESTRSSGILLLLDLMEVSKNFQTDDALVIRDYASLVGTSEPFYLLTTPTIFPPEKWSQTLLSALKKETTQDQVVLEIGTGSGILPLYLAKLGGVQKVWTFDANPDARIVGGLNAWLMSTDEQGEKKEGVQPIDVVEFGGPSDLMAQVSDDLKVDRIIACLPQVPSTDKLTTRNLADRYQSQGYPEDRDGLELLARLLEEGEEHLNKGGEINLIVSGRPGVTAIEQMARRRGYVYTPIISTTFPQDKWTDLGQFVAIEKSGLRAPFEFLHGERMISATEADQILRRFQHRFSKIKSEEKRKALAEDPAYDVRHRQYVLRFIPVSHLQETLKTQAVSEVTAWLNRSHRIPYTQNTGTEYPPFRTAMARHLSFLMGARIPPEILFVGPSLEVLVYNFLLATVSSLNLGMAGFKSKTTKEGEIEMEGMMDTTDAPPIVFVDPLLESIKKSLEPYSHYWDFDEAERAWATVRIYSLGNPDIELEEFLEEGRIVGSYALFIAGPDDSHRLDELSRLLQEHPEYRQDTAILWQNSDLPAGQTPLATLILWNNPVREAMTMIGEDTYSRISTLQAVYETALLDQIGEGDAVPLLPELGPYPDEESTEDLAPRALFLSLFQSHPPPLPESASTIDLSFGESEFAVPDEWIPHLTTSLAREANPLKVQRAIVRLLTAEKGLPFKTDEVVLGSGVHPLIERTIDFFDDGDPFRVMIPEGSYGQFLSTIFIGGGDDETFEISPSQTDQELIDALNKAYRKEDKDNPVKILLLTNPSNPGGRYYSREQLITIVRFCQKHRIFILTDEIFWNTEDPAFEGDKVSLFELLEDPQVGRFLEAHLIGFGGISKEFAFGGGRFGFMFSKNKNLLQKIANQQMTPVNEWGLRLAHASYDPLFRRAHTTAHRQWLSEQRTGMIDFLNPYADAGMIRFEKPEAGYFAEVDVSQFFGLTITTAKGRWTIDEEGKNLREVIFESCDIKISPVGWSGNPKTLRLVFSIQNLPEALSRLKPFFDGALVAWQHQTVEKSEPLGPVSLDEKSETDPDPENDGGNHRGRKRSYRKGAGTGIARPRQAKVLPFRAPTIPK